MLEVRLAHPQEREEAQRLWTSVFGESGEEQEQFYALCAPQGPMILRDEGELRSMLVLSPCDLVFGDGWKVRGAYLYALATRQEDRGKGYAATLIHTTCAVKREEGLDFIATVPAQPSLFDFFAAQGFEAGFYHHRIPTPAQTSGSWEELTPEGYITLREELLAGCTHVVHTPGQAAYEQVMGGKLYRLDLHHGPGCAVVEPWEEGPVIKELLTLPGDEAAAGGMAAALCGGRGQLRTPCGGGEEGVPFGAIRWLHGHPPRRWREHPRGYLGLGLD